MDDEPRAGMTYTVRQGDGMSSIASRTGHFWPTLWDDPANAGLKARRRDPEILLPGDMVVIPPLRIKTERLQTGHRYRFRRKGVPVLVRFSVRDVRGRTLAGRKYQLEVGEKVYEGVTDEEGRLEQYVAPVATEGRLTVLNDSPLYPRRMSWTLRIGCLDPIDALTGVQARLSNLGFDCGDEHGAEGPRTQAAVRTFQARNRLEPTGQVDESTRKALQEAHGS
ncbi:MAG: hypothetical protein QOH06_2116 [Acidobacteriota bacterium]|jgi:hypothetical protein|nr:hypothetical protein [Acidobacteriota bacterium]